MMLSLTSYFELQTLYFELRTSNFELQTFNAGCSVQQPAL